MFGFAPPFVIAVAYFVACIYLWVLWQVFLPGAETPFGHGNPGPIYGFQNICIQTGKFYYIGAPILVGWAMGLIAARQRVKAVWPIAGSALVALMSGGVQIHANRIEVPHGLGHISMNFTLGTSVQDICSRLLYTFVVLSLTMLPYLIWRLRRAQSFSA